MFDIASFKLSAKDFTPVGTGLARPECVLVAPDGVLWTSDRRGGVTRLSSDGHQRTIGGIAGLPNGIAREAAGSLIVAEIDHGIVYRLHPDGSSEMVLDNLNGTPLGAVNFVLVDSLDRIWVTVSTRLSPRKPAAATPHYDGYIILVDTSGARIVADGLCYPNELRLDASGRFLLVSETSARRITRFSLAEDGSLTEPFPYGPQSLPGRPDGITFDAEGNLWFTDVDRNAIGTIGPGGMLHYVFEDIAGEVLNFPSSLAFGGHDGRTVYVGSVQQDHLMSFRAPVRGLG